MKPVCVAGPRRLRLRGPDRRLLLRRRGLGPHLQRRGRLLRARLRAGAAQRLPDRPELPRHHERRRPVLGRDVPQPTRTAARRSRTAISAAAAGRALRAVPLRHRLRRAAGLRPDQEEVRRVRPPGDDRPQCRPELAGSQCLTDGRCGCLADADCGGVTSGRVCDATASRCVPGCRGTGGNGCPNEQVCSSTTDEIGRCDAAPADGRRRRRRTDGSTDGGVGRGHRRRRGTRRARTRAAWTPAPTRTMPAVGRRGPAARRDVTGCR